MLLHFECDLSKLQDIFFSKCHVPRFSHTVIFWQGLFKECDVHRAFQADWRSKQRQLVFVQYGIYALYQCRILLHIVCQQMLQI